MENNIPNNLLPYFYEIATKLWSGHATIMVGAGFSKNAKGGEAIVKSFPTWNELGNCFFKKLYGKFPTDKDQRYLNVLKLADEVQAAFGRNTLDQILKTEIPDKEYEPSDLHEKILKLPWNDVFTTNYDTLLERTAERILQQRYETVINKEDLILSTKPRIIKLHGSFPSERPFIITEEDYRKYPFDYAPFVNTVQQSLLENTLCLVGFSGDDPNFLKWIGWIRDNLGIDNSPKIYLIGILRLSVGERKLLENRNIIPLDLSDINDVDKNHKRALEIFVDFLHKQGKVEETLNWPNEQRNFRFDDKKDLDEQLRMIIGKWKTDRLKYPNWIIVPTDRREVLQTYTEDCSSFIYHLGKTENTLDIEFLYEFNWRNEKCLNPIYNGWSEFYENILLRYNPYPDYLENNNAVFNANINESVDWTIVTNYWIDLQLSLLRFYREEEFNQKWIALSDKIEKIINHLPSEALAKYRYERCLYALFSFDIKRVRTEVADWKIDVSLPYMEAKRAGLLAELGDLSDAERILEESLKTIRNRLYLSPVVNDYTAVSQESYILLLLKYIKNAIELSNGNYFPKSIKDYNDRWNKLVQYKCDPWGELKLFELYLQNESYDFRLVEKKYKFEIGSVTVTRHLNKSDKYAEKSYSFLRFIEDTGIPFKLPGGSHLRQDIANKAIAYIANYSSAWALVSYIRNGDDNFIESIFGRKALSFMTQDYVNQLISKYLLILELSFDEIIKADLHRNSNFAISISTITPEILSRLCTKSSKDNKIKLLDFAKEIYISEFKDRYKGVGNLVKRIIGSFSIEEQYQLLNRFLEFPIIENPSYYEDKEFVDPFYFIDIENIGLAKMEQIIIEDEIIERLLNNILSTGAQRVISIKRLITLFKCGFLNENQVELFGHNLWYKIDQNTGFPIETNLHYFYFLALPHPKNVNPTRLLKNYFFSTPIEIYAQKAERGLSITNGQSNLFYNIMGTTNSDVEFVWTKSEIKIMLEKVISWWDADKKYLLDTEQDPLIGSVSKEFKARFKNLTRFFSMILIKNINLVDEKHLKEIGRILDEFDEYGVNGLDAKTALFNMFSQKQRIIIDEINKIIFSKDESKIKDVTNAIIVLSEQDYSNIYDLIKYVSENIRCRTNVELYRHIETISVIFNKNSEIFDEKIMFDIETGLHYLIEETEVIENDIDEMVHNKLLTRMKTARLVAILLNYYSDKNENTPGYLLNWKDICMDENQFSEIKNEFINNID